MMIERLPFYMVYQTEEFSKEMKKPFPGEQYGGRNSMFPNGRFRDEESLIRRDYDYMKSAYPDAAKKIVPYVEEECDRMEYSGSVMFDEYPDQLQLRLLCRRIYNKVKVQEENPGKWLEDLIHVVTWQEILRRRSEHRNYRRRFY